MTDTSNTLDQINWDKGNGIVPVVVQDTKGTVLTLGYINKEALSETLKTGLMHYFSRSKSRVRMKGEVSGNIQKVKEIRIDCDNDALLVIVEQKGAACHTGHYSCFYRKIGESQRTKPGIDYSLNVLKKLEETIKTRKSTMPEDSYTSTLFKEGKEKIYKKFGEEAIEVIVAENKERIIYETADLLYHLLVLLSLNNITLKEIMEELSSRRK